MKCDLPKHNLFDAGLLVSMYNGHGKKARVKTCVECKSFHVITEDDDDEIRKN